MRKRGACRSVPPALDPALRARPGLSGARACPERRSRPRGRPPSPRARPAAPPPPGACGTVRWRRLAAGCGPRSSNGAVPMSSAASPCTSCWPGAAGTGQSLPRLSSRPSGRCWARASCQEPLGLEPVWQNVPLRGGAPHAPGLKLDMGAASSRRQGAGRTGRACRHPLRILPQAARRDGIRTGLGRLQGMPCWSRAGGSPARVGLVLTKAGPVGKECRVDEVSIFSRLPFPSQGKARLLRLSGPVLPAAEERMPAVNAASDACSVLRRRALLAVLCLGLALGACGGRKVAPVRGGGP